MHHSRRRERRDCTSRSHPGSHALLATRLLLLLLLELLELLHLLQLGELIGLLLLVLLLLLLVLLLLVVALTLLKVAEREGGVGVLEHEGGILQRTRTGSHW